MKYFPIPVPVSALLLPLSSRRTPYSYSKHFITSANSNSLGLHLRFATTNSASSLSSLTKRHQPSLRHLHLPVISAYYLRYPPVTLANNETHIQRRQRVLPSLQNGGRTGSHGPYSLITVAMAENRLPYHRCLISVCPMVIRSRFGTLKGLFLLPGGVYTDNSYSLGVIRSFKINNAIRNGLSNRMCGMARFYCSCVLVNRLNRPGPYFPKSEIHARALG